MRTYRIATIIGIAFFVIQLFISFDILFKLLQSTYLIQTENIVLVIFSNLTLLSLIPILRFFHERAYHIWLLVIYLMLNVLIADILPSVISTATYRDFLVLIMGLSLLSTGLQLAFLISLFFVYSKPLSGLFKALGIIMLITLVCRISISILTSLHSSPTMSAIVALLNILPIPIILALHKKMYDYKMQTLHTVEQVANMNTENLREGDL